MSAAGPPLQARKDAAGEGQAFPPLQRIILDGRRPQLLDHHGYGMQVVASYVDLFAVSLVDGKIDGARHHLFRVEKGEIILDLPATAHHPIGRAQVIAVGGPGAEVLILPRRQIESDDFIAAWIRQLGKAIIGPNVDWTIHEAPADVRCDLGPGERRRGSAHNLVWTSVEAGVVRLMGLEAAYQPNDPPVPLTCGF